MPKPKRNPVAIEVPPEVASMKPKQIILLMRNLGVGKENYAPPHHARSWTTAEFLEACTRDDVIRRAEKFPPERTTIDSWFNASGPIPDDRKGAWHYFFHVFFSYERREFGTLEWKAAYFDSLRRESIAKALEGQHEEPQKLPLQDPLDPPTINILPLLRGKE